MREDSNPVGLTGMSSFQYRRLSHISLNSTGKILLFTVILLVGLASYFPTSVHALSSDLPFEQWRGTISFHNNYVFNFCCNTKNQTSSIILDASGSGTWQLTAGYEVPNGSFLDIRSRDCINLMDNNCILQNYAINGTVEVNTTGTAQWNDPDCSGPDMSQSFSFTDLEGIRGAYNSTTFLAGLGYEISGGYKGPETVVLSGHYSPTGDICSKVVGFDGCCGNGFVPAAFPIGGVGVFLQSQLGSSAHSERDRSCSQVTPTLCGKMYDWYSSSIDDLAITSGRLFFPLTVNTPVSSSPVLDAGQSTMLSTTFNGGLGPFTCQWGQKTPSDVSYSGLTNVLACSSGSSSQTSPLTITGVWSFNLQVRDGIGEIVTSNPSALTVNSPLIAGAINPMAPAVHKGSSITLTSDVSGGTPPYFYQWYSGNSPDCLSDTVRLGTSADQNVSPSTETDYCFLVTDSSKGSPAARSISDTDHVSISPPLAVGKPNATPSTINSQESSILSVTFTGGSSPYVCEWFQKAPGENSYSELSNSSPQCTPAVSETTDLLSTVGIWSYKIRVTDASGVSVTSDPVTITVNKRNGPPPNPGPLQYLSYCLNPESLLTDIHCVLTDLPVIGVAIGAVFRFGFWIVKKLENPLSTPAINSLKLSKKGWIKHRSSKLKLG